MKWWCFVIIWGLVLLSDAKKVKKQRGKAKKGGGMTEIDNLKKNLSALWTEVNDFGSSRVMVHVHGMGDDDADTHHDGAGTHVHIHMHMDEEHHGHHGMHGHQGHGSLKDLHKHLHHPDHEEYQYGRCEMAMNSKLTGSQHNIQGSIFFRQKVHQPLEILLHLAGFNLPAGDHDHSGHSEHSGHSHHTDHAGHEGHVHGFHVHEFGDMSNGCASLGDHYNPDDADHGGHGSDVRHAGDWGTIECDMKGEVHSDMNDTITSIVGPHSIMGRGVVISETAEGGDRLACCTIAWSAEQDWDQLREHHTHEH